MFVVPEIIPVILAQTEHEAFAHFASAGEAEWIQLDCLDGHFVPNTSFFDASTWPKEGPSIELHLLCQDPLFVMHAWQAHPLFARAVWHIEAPMHHEALIAWCRDHGIEAGLALSPETPLTRVMPFLSKIDTLLLLGVHPGWSGQPFLPTTLHKLEQAHALAPTLPIGIDGGITEALIPSLCERGVSIIYAASAVFRDARRTPADALQHLQRIAHDTLV